MSLATYPVVLTLGSRLPGQLTDPLEHLWIMRWSRACWLEGRSPFFIAVLNAPTGLPLGYFPTLHVQTLGFLAIGLMTDNDVAAFNVLWLSGFLATGLGGFVLAWWTVRRLGPAWLSGLAAMLCGPMMMHAHGHLETMQMGAVPLFLIAWIRFVEGPKWSSLAVAVGLYGLVVASAPYFAVLAVFPSVWFVVWSIHASQSRRSWIETKVGWLMAFGIVALGVASLLFASQVWAVAQGYPLSRTRSEFNQLGAPVWSTVVPSPRHALGQLGLPDLFERTGYASRMAECSSYLGVVTLGLLAYAAIRRVAFPRRDYWWSALGLMVVLSWGSGLEVGSTRISLPAGWIHEVFPPFHLIRVPARFNLFAAICAVVPASAALADLLGRFRHAGSRLILLGLGSSLTLIDLAMVPFETASIPIMPSAYHAIAQARPDATILDAPLFGSNEGQIFSSLWEYWQSIHRLGTSAGYPGVPNLAFEAEVVRPSPFWANRWLDPRYMARPGLESYGPVQQVDPRDHAWLYLKAHRFDRVFVHQGIAMDPKYAVGAGRIKALLAESKTFEDADVAVFDPARLRPPTRLTWLCAQGFRPAQAKHLDWSHGVLASGRIVVYEPDSDRRVVLRLENLSSFGRSRVVRVVEQDRELARWTIEPGEAKPVETPPFRLNPGVRELRILSDGVDRPERSADRLDDARTSYSLRVGGIGLRRAVETKGR